MADSSNSQTQGVGFATVPQHILTQQLEDELILLDTEKGQYFSLNEVGSRMWTLLQQGKDLEGVLNDMLQEYEVEESKLRADLAKFVDKLTSQGFLQPRDS